MKSKVIFIFLFLQFAFGGNSQTLTRSIAVPINQTQSIDNTPINFANATQGGVSAGISKSIGDNSDIKIFPSANTQSEVHISINRANPNILLASANTYNPNTENQNQGYYYSIDGGNTWQGADALQNSPARVWGDPSTAISANGRMYISTINYYSGGYSIQNSANNGTTFSALVASATGVSNFDKEMIAADDQPNSPFVNNVYCSWTNFSAGYGNIEFNRSVDNGGTFSTPITLKNGNGWGQGANVQTGPNGEIYVCWADYNVDEYGNYLTPAAGLGFVSSANGGVSFTNYQRVFIYNGIRTSFNPISIFGNIKMNDFPSMAVDKSNSTVRGRIYVCYPEFDANQRSIIRVRASDNKGVTWTNPITVSIANATQSFFPWITVDQFAGDILVAYYAFDNPSVNYSTNTYVAHSSDGGITWENMKISDVAHITAPIPYYSSGYSGDYIGIAAYGGRAYPAWMDNRNGTWQIYVSPINYTTATPPCVNDYTNQTIASNTTVNGCTNLNVQNVSVTNNSKLTLNAPGEVTINGNFEVQLGSQLEIKSP